MQDLTENKSHSPPLSGNTPPTSWTPDRVAALSRAAAMVVGGGVVVGLFVATSNLYYVAAAIVALVLFVLIAWQFEAALAVYALVAFVPWGRTPDLAVGGSGVGKGVFVSQAMLAFLLAIWCAKYLMRSLPRTRITTGFYLPLGLYLIYCVINVIHSHLFWDPHVSREYQHLSVNVIDVGLRFLSVGALVVMATTISSRKWLSWTTGAVLAAGFFNLLNGVAGYVVPFQAPWWALVTVLPCAYCCAVALDKTRTAPVRILCAVLLVLSVSVIFVRNVSWVSGWLATLLALFVVVAIKSWRLFIVCAAVALVIALVISPFIDEHIVTASKEEGDYDRFALLKGAWKYATTFPLGVGLGNYRSYNTYHYGEKWGTTGYTSAHGTYSQSLAETGLPGTGLLLAFLTSGFLWMLRSYRMMAPGASKTFLLATMGQLVAIAVAAFIGDYIVPAYHNGGLTTFSTTVYSWLIWGLAIAHVRIAGAEQNGSVDINN